MVKRTLLLHLLAGGLIGVAAGLTNNHAIQLTLVFIAALVGLRAGFRIWRIREHRISNGR